MEPFETYRRSLFALAYRMLGSALDAEDLVQETYLRAWRAFHTYTPGTNLKAWLFRILRNVNIDRHRAYCRSRSVTGGTPQPRGFEPPPVLPPRACRAYAQDP